MPGPKTDIGSQIAAIALQFIGADYVWGGAPGPGFTGNWDCSSFVNSVVGHYAHQSIPGYPDGTYNGLEHGPNTTMWLAAQGTVVGSIPRAALRAGDIPCWTSHMGVAISNTRMVSAQDPATGVQVGIVDGFMPGEVLTCLRLATIGPGGVTFPPVDFTGQATMHRTQVAVAAAIRQMVNQQVRIKNVGRFGWRV